MRRLIPCVLAPLVLACQSSAPYTIPSAALNSALAAGASAGQRAAGGCYAVCTHGTVCNPRTGFCERDSAPCAASSADPGCGGVAPVWGVEQTTRPTSTSGFTPALGVSPATGRPPPRPGQRAPEDAP